MQWWELSKVAILLDYWDCFQGNIKQHLFNNPSLKCTARKKTPVRWTFVWLLHTTRIYLT